jgi:hypothetical protein
MILPLLQKHLPSSTVNYCYHIWKSYPFNFKVTKKRETKLGDYRYHYGDKTHTITINGDLNAYSFLVTYLHEVAHLRTQVLCGHKVKPHGKEWKEEFQKLLHPVSNDDVFPDTLLKAIHNYLQNPKASSCTDINLLKALGEFDNKEQNVLFLSDVAIGVTFKFNKKYYVKESTLRTRAICQEVKSGRKFYIPEAAQVEVKQLTLF